MNTMGSLHLELSWTLPYVPVLVFGFNLFPFAIIYHNYEYNRFTGFCLSSELLNLKVVLGSSELSNFSVSLCNPGMVNKED